MLVMPCKSTTYLVTAICLADGPQSIDANGYVLETCPCIGFDPGARVRKFHNQEVA